MKQASLLVVGALLALVGCRGERTVGPRTPQGATPQPAATAAPTKTFLSVSPTSLTFSGAGDNQQSFTASTAVRTLLHAFTSNQEVATVNPPAATTSKDMGGYSAPFAVTPVGVGRATVTVTDRKGHQAAVAVTVLGKLFYVANAGADNIEVFAAGENGDAAPHAHHRRQQYATGLSNWCRVERGERALRDQLPNQ